MRRALSLTFKLTMETTIMIESLIKILEQTPAGKLCSVAGCAHHVDCSLCPFVSDYRKEILVEELEELSHESQ